MLEDYNCTRIRLQRNEIDAEMNKLEQSTSGLYLPFTGPVTADELKEMVASPLMEFLIRNMFNAWVLDSGNHKTAWNSPIYSHLSFVQDTTMQGITLIQRASDVPQSKGWTITSMLARAVSIARFACLSLALGSVSDAFANYRMLIEREMTLLYLEEKNEYEEFAQAFYAEIYQRGNRGLNATDLRASFTAEELENSKDIMDLIRTKYFDGYPPRSPGHYWTRPTSESLADVYARKTSVGPDDPSYRRMMRVYDLGNRSVHPQLRDMLQPEDSDISPEDIRGLILTTLASTSIFGLSRFKESSGLSNEIEKQVQSYVALSDSKIQDLME